MTEQKPDTEQQRKDAFEATRALSDELEGTSPYATIMNDIFANSPEFVEKMKGH